METDRGAVLTVRAHLAGAIDFREARLRDVAWWRRANVILRGLAQRQDVEVIRTAYEFQLALLSNGNLTEDSFKKFQDLAKETCNEIVNALHPWASKSVEAVKQQEVTGLIEMYKQLVGDPADPAFRAKLARIASEDEARKRDSSAEPEEERVNRLLREADDERRRRQAKAARRRD